MNDFEVSRAIGKCSVTGRQFAEGETFYSALFETPQGFERRDYCADAWHGPPEGALCHFKTRLPKKEEVQKTFVDSEVLISFFLRLTDSEEPIKLQFRFVLSLILLRKRLLKYERTIREGGGEYWEMRLMRDKTVHRVFNPALADDQIEALTAELGAILAGRPPNAMDDEQTVSPSGASAWVEGGLPL